MSRELSHPAKIALWVVFAVITAVDVLAFRGLLWSTEPDREVVHKAVFEREGERITARAVPWHYPMVPHPTPYDERTLLLPPGYPVLVEVGPEAVPAFDLRIYEEPAVGLILVRPRGEQSAAWRWLGLDDAGMPVAPEVRSKAPSIEQSAALGACFEDGGAPGADRVFQIHTGEGLSVLAGRCRWRLDLDAVDVVMTSQASARLEMTGERDIGRGHFAWLLFLLIVAGSLATRWALANIAWVLTDLVATLFVFTVSFFSPVWLLLWGGKAAFGLLVAGHRLWLLLKRDPRWWWPAGGAVAVGGVLALIIDPAAAADWYTGVNADAQIEAMRSVDDRRELDLDQTSHLVLGYSTVNAAAAGRGAYGSAALDQVLQRTCGEGRRFDRHGVDGANLCLMADTWTEMSERADHVETRIFVGGFNDDIAPSLRNLKAVVPSILALVPAAEPFPSVEAAWHRSAVANVETGSRVDDALGCLQAIADAGDAERFVYIYDLGIFDLGRTRAHGRAAWERLRREQVEAAGGAYLDLRDLWPDESLVYFNDFVHPSEVGYELMAAGLCERLKPVSPR